MKKNTTHEFDVEMWGRDRDNSVSMGQFSIASLVDAGVIEIGTNGQGNPMIGIDIDHLIKLKPDGRLSAIGIVIGLHDKSEKRPVDLDIDLSTGRKHRCNPPAVPDMFSVGDEEEDTWYTTNPEFEFDPEYDPDWDPDPGPDWDDDFCTDVDDGDCEAWSDDEEEDEDPDLDEEDEDLDLDLDEEDEDPVDNRPTYNEYPLFVNCTEDVKNLSDMLYAGRQFKLAKDVCHPGELRTETAKRIDDFVDKLDRRYKTLTKSQRAAIKLTSKANLDNHTLMFGMLRLYEKWNKNATLLCLANSDYAQVYANGVAANEHGFCCQPGCTESSSHTEVVTGMVFCEQHFREIASSIAADRNLRGTFKSVEERAAEQERKRNT